MESAIVIALVVVVLLILLIGLGSRTSIGAYLLPKEVEAAAQKAAGRNEIIDAQVEVDGRFALTLRGSAGLTDMKVRRHGEITVSVAYRSFEWPRKGSFAFRTTEASQRDDPHISPEGWAHARQALGEALASKGFVPAEGSQCPTILVSYLMATDKPMSATQLDRVHSFVAAEHDAGESEQATPVTHVFKQGTLVIDISDGASDTLFWRAAAVADVSLSDDLPLKKARLERAIQAMFANFPLPQKWTQ